MANKPKNADVLQPGDQIPEDQISVKEEKIDDVFPSDPDDGDIRRPAESAEAEMDGADESVAPVESMTVTDPEGELLSQTANLAGSLGYTVKQLDLKSEQPAYAKEAAQYQLAQKLTSMQEARDEPAPMDGFVADPDESPVPEGEAADEVSEAVRNPLEDLTTTARQRGDERLAALTELDQLYDALRRKQMLTVSVTAVEAEGNNVIAKCSFGTGQYALILPYDEAYAKDPISSFDDAPSDGNGLSIRYMARQRRDRERQMLTSLLGARIQVLVKEIVRGEGNRREIYVSRKAALEVLRHRYFDNPHASIAAQENTLVPAYILTVGTHSALVSCMGFDIPVHKSALTCRYAQSLTELVDEQNNPVFLPGMRIQVVLRKIIYDNEGRATGLVIYRKPVESAELMRRNAHLAKTGNVVLGTVTNIVRNKNSPNTFTVFLNGVKLPALAVSVARDAMRSSIREGTTVRARIMRVPNEDEIKRGKIITVSILGVVGAR